MEEIELTSKSISPIVVDSVSGGCVDENGSVVVGFHKTGGFDRSSIGKTCSVYAI